MKALVTGGGGFLGRNIVQQLLARGDRVAILSRSHYPDLEALGVESFRGDLADAPVVLAACEGQDAVFHVAARVGVGGSYRQFHETNVTGTENVLAACRACRVPKLVFSSSPSVVFDGSDQLGVDESHPYPAGHLAHYPATKAEAERRVLEANGSGGLTTCALRPHLIFGPGDTSLLPRLADRARRGLLRQVGDGTNRVDVVYVGNAAEAHLLAADSDAVGGKAYFITQGEPVVLWDWIRELLRRLGLPSIRGKVPYAAAYAAGALAEATHALLGLSGEPGITRFVAAELAHSHFYDISRARRDFGWVPRVSLAEGMDRLEAWWKAGRP